MQSGQICVANTVCLNVAPEQQFFSLPKEPAIETDTENKCTPSSTICCAGWQRFLPSRPLPADTSPSAGSRMLSLGTETHWALWNAWQSLGLPGASFNLLHLKGSTALLLTSKAMGLSPRVEISSNINWIKRGGFPSKNCHFLGYGMRFVLYTITTRLKHWKTGALFSGWAHCMPGFGREEHHVQKLEVELGLPEHSPAEGQHEGREKHCSSWGWE